MKVKLTAVLTTILILAIGLLGFHRVLLNKDVDGILGMQSFYELKKDSLDLMVLGSSHAYMNINPMVIWEDTGIAAYDLGGPKAMLWHSYHHLKEGLKTQKPDLVILDVYSLIEDDEYLEGASNLENIYGMRPSLNKWETIKDSFPPEEYRENVLEYIRYHNRYNNLSPKDFKRYRDDVPRYGNWKGMFTAFDYDESEMPVVNNTGQRADIPPKQLEFLQKIIEYCKDNEQELLLIVVPYRSYCEDDAQIYNTARDIAAKAGISFVDFNENYDEIGFDWQEDFVDGVHFSWRGNARFSHYLSDYLSKNYSWEKHAEDDKRYTSWDEANEYYKRSIQNFELSLITDPGDYVRALNSLPDGYTILINAPGAVPLTEDTNEIVQMLIEKGIPTDGGTDKTRRATWIIEGKEILLASKTGYGYNWSKRYGGKNLLADETGIYWYRENYQVTDSGVNIVVFDEKNQTVADAIGVTDAICRAE